MGQDYCQVLVNFCIVSARNPLLNTGMKKKIIIVECSSRSKFNNQPTNCLLIDLDFHTTKLSTYNIFEMLAIYETFFQILLQFADKNEKFTYFVGKFLQCYL